MDALRVVLLFVLLGLAAAEEVFRPSTNSGAISFGNFILHRSYKLHAVKLKDERVRSSVLCLIRCIGTQGCLSVNVNTSSDEQGLYACELLAADKYDNQSDFRASEGFDHYSIASACEHKPCKHRGKCVPSYTNNTYKCECLTGTLGQDCEVPDFRSCAQRFAAGYTNSGVYEITTPDNNKVDVYCDHGNGEGWTMVFKAVSGVPLQQKGPSVLWLSSSILESSSSALPINSSYRQHYKNRIIEQWQAFNPTQVRLSLYKNKTQAVRLVFNARGSDKTNWFSRARLVTSPWTDIHSQPVNYFSITGDIRSMLRRTFFINSIYGACPIDKGWMMLVELTPGGCSWETGAQHSIFYSPTTSVVHWSTPGAFSVADMMAIYIR